MGNSLLATDSVVLQAFVAAFITMLVTGLGALPVLFTDRLPERLVGGGYALAGGLMLSVTFFDLFIPALDRGAPWEVALGIGLGGFVFWIGDRYLEGRDHAHVAGLRGAGARRVMLILGTMFIHSFAEGVAVGVGYASGEARLGLFIAVAIAIHNIPEGLATSLPLAAEGVGFWRCFFYAVLSSLPQPVMAVPAVLLIQLSEELLPGALGFAGGAMTYLVLAELLPESHEASGKHITAWSFLIGFVGMMLVQRTF